MNRLVSDNLARPYDEMIANCVKMCATAPNPAEAQARGERVLLSLMPGWFPRFFGFFLGLFAEWFSARHAAATTPLLLPWLVGRDPQPALVIGRHTV